MGKVKVKVSTATKSKKVQAPRNPQAKKAYYEEYGKQLAQHKMWEVKAAKFGRLGTQDRQAGISPKRKEGYTQIDRKDVYKKALSLYEQDEIVRPVINLLAAAIGKADPRGSNKTLVDLAKNMLENNELNLYDTNREGELAGDVFLWYKPNGDLTEIRSLDASKIDVVLKDDNIRTVAGYLLGDEDPQSIKPKFIQQLKFNSTTTSQYGRSSLRHLIYWIDVIDSLFEKNWLRGAQYYGNPLLAVTGVPGPYQAAVKQQIEAEIQRSGKSWILPEGTDVKVPDFSLDYPIKDIVGWVFRLISIGAEVPVTLLGTADAGSRGSAFFANPRLNLAISPKREVWRIGWRNFFIKIFKNIGVLDKSKLLSVKEFDFAFLPIFDKDLADLADVIEIYRSLGLISARSAQELIGLDHDEEQAFLDQEEPIVPVTPEEAKKLKEKRIKARERRKAEEDKK